MAVTEKQLQKIQDLTDRIHRLRNVLGDQDSPPQLIVRQKRHARGTFKRRQDVLRRLEIERDNLLTRLTTAP
jgi:hypothetical protein